MKGTVPAAGLEPAQTRFQRPVGCQLPYAGPRPLRTQRRPLTPRYRAAVTAACWQTPAAKTFHCQPGSQLWGRIIAAAVHGRAGPAFDPSVKARALLHVDPQTAAIIITDIPADCLGVMPLEGRTVELRGVGTSYLQPVALGGAYIGGLVNIDAIADLRAINPRCVQ